MPVSPAELVPSTFSSGPPWFLGLLLFVTFVVHLLFVNAVAGVAVITLATRAKAWLRPSPGTAFGLSPLLETAVRTQSAFLPKGLALVVNLGVPPLLFVQALYGPYIYTSSILSAVYWLSLFGVVMLAYYGLYLNTSTKGLTSGMRNTALLFSVVLLLFTAFVLTNNITLMQNPQSWLRYAENSGGTLLNTTDPQLFPRWLHMVLGCIAVGGLVIAVAAAHTLEKSAAQKDAEHLYLAESRRKCGLLWFSRVTMLQLIVGAWFLHSLPSEAVALFTGKGGFETALLGISLPLTFASLWAAKKQKAKTAAAAALAVIICMAGMRTLLRDFLLAPYPQAKGEFTQLSPAIFFIASLAVSAVFVAWLFKLYRKRDLVPMPPGEESAEDEIIPMLELGASTDTLEPDSPDASAATSEETRDSAFKAEAEGGPR